MTVGSNTTSIVNTALAALPQILASLRSNHAEANPGAPPLTDAEVIAGLKSAVDTSLAKDDAIEADVKRRNPSA